MRLVERGRLNMGATVIAVVAIALAVTVPIALGRDAAGGPVTNYVTYTGGKAGKANPRLSPVYIGGLNTQGGQVLVGPGWTKGAQTAVDYVNKYLGGVQGHPLKLITCFTTSAEEDGTKCGQKFGNDKRIVAVLAGAVAVGNQSFYAALGGKKPIVSGVALLPVDATQKNGFALFGTNDSVLGPWGTFAKTQLHAKTAAVIYPQVPGIDEGAKVEKTSLEAAGITTKLVGFDPNATDLTGPLTAAGAQTADIVVPQSNAAGCVNVAKTLQQLGVKGSKIVSNPLCLSGEVAAGLGGDLAPWVYGIASTLAADKTDPAAKPFNRGLALLGQSKLASDAWVIVAWGQVLTTAKMINQLGVRKATPATFTKAIRNFKGPQALGAPSLQCGKYKTEPAACNDQTQFFQYEGKGVFHRLTGWLRPPPGFTPSG
ncbi:MAG TPA: ABC transporter substrate-binding protein [Gaiellaceae bacterium]|jgi:branched-chain amino acid transport system substrate-binding protein|nr:ABC transporter substrate-binding protein [Gaiellaceae bacterium]